MSGKTRWLAAAVASMMLAAPLLVTGCSDSEAKAVAASAVAVAGKVRTFATSLTSTLKLKQTGRDASTINVKTSGSGLVDTEGRLSHIQMNLNMEVVGDTQQAMDLDIYVTEPYQYMKIPMGDAGEKWVKIALATDWVAAANQMVQQASLLKTGTRIQMAGSEVVDGVEAYKITFKPDAMSLIRVMLSQSQAHYIVGISESDFSTLKLSKVVKNATVTEWIAKDTFRVLKAQADLNVVLKPEDTGAKPEDFDTVTFTMSITLAFKDFDKAVDIVVPDEALAAVDMAEASSTTEEPATTTEAATSTESAPATSTSTTSPSTTTATSTTATP